MDESHSRWADRREALLYLTAKAPKLGDDSIPDLREEDPDIVGPRNDRGAIGVGYEPRDTYL